MSSNKKISIKEACLEKKANLLMTEIIGIHPIYSKYYKRVIRFCDNDPISTIYKESELK